MTAFYPVAAQSSIAQPCGECVRCGGTTMYANLAHICQTSLRLSENVQTSSAHPGKLRLTPRGTWEWVPW